MNNARKYLRSFLERLAPHIHLVSIEPDSRHVEARHFGDGVTAAERWSLARNSAGANVYYSVNVCSPGLDRKPRKKEIVAVRYAHVDVDPPKDGANWDLEATITRLLVAQPSPSTVVRSGNGVQALWPVDGATIAQIELVNRGLIKRFRGDRGTHNADRLLRVPGTTNYPDERKRAAGRRPTPASMVIGNVRPEMPYAIEELLSGFGDDEEVNAIGHGEITIGDFDLITADTLELSPRDPLRKLIDHPKGVDRSSDGYALACEMFRRGFSPEQAVGLLLNPANPVSSHCLDQKDQNRAAARATSMAWAAVKRREAQRSENRRIGEGDAIIPVATVLDLDQMLENYVFVTDGSQVANLLRPCLVQSLADFKNTVAASFHQVVQPDGRRKTVACSKAWLEHPKRKEVDTLTFRAGAPAITTAPQSRGTALNTWSPIERGDAPPDWMGRASMFVEHLTWLWGEHADEFLDFLAHAEQRPGELPQFGWIHVSQTHGKGRNWIAGVIARLWSGHVASSLDLMSILEDGFNARLSRCLFGIVDEIYEGGRESYRHAQALKKLVTEDSREINPKYGRRHVEYNSMRWLFFSNHTGAIPLGEEDRRFYVVEHAGAVQSDEYYERLYGRLADPWFVRSVAEFLRQRDISKFRLGKRPPMTAAKSALIGFSRTEEEEKLLELAKHWPVEIISASELKAKFDAEILKRASARHAMDRAGIRKLKKVRLGDVSEMVYTLSDHASWAVSSPEAIKYELESVTWERKLELMEHGEAAGWARL